MTRTEQIKRGPMIFTWLTAVLCAAASLAWPSAARAQWVSASLGGMFPHDFTQTDAGAQANFSHATEVSLDGGMGFLPFLEAEIHYSHATPELVLQRADLSSASVDVTTHTITIDARVHTPQIAGFRAYGLLGFGLSRFNADVKLQSGVPFPGGEPGSIVEPTLTYGGGVEKGLLPLVRVKVELRDDVSRIPKELYAPGGTWQRPQILAGIVIGR